MRCRLAVQSTDINYCILYTYFFLITSFFFRKKDDVAIKSIKSLLGRVSENTNNGVATLIIEHSTEEDAGNYTCTALIKQTEIMSKTIQAVCKYLD